MDAYLGEIRLFPYTFVPQDWLPCDGRQVMISQYQALFAVIGATFGPYTSSMFTLPNLQGQTAMGMGTGPGLTARTIGQSVGANAENVTLLSAQMPNHTHGMIGVFQGDTSVTLTAAPTPGSYFTYPNYTEGQTNFSSNDYLSTGNANTTLGQAAITPAGGGQGHPNMQPYLTLQWCICCWGGDFPMRP